jgi:hypothetical protein
MSQLAWPRRVTSSAADDHYPDMSQPGAGLRPLPSTTPPHRARRTDASAPRSTLWEGTTLRRHQELAPLSAPHGARSTAPPLHSAPVVCRWLASMRHGVPSQLRVVRRTRKLLERSAVVRGRTGRRGRGDIPRADAHGSSNNPGFSVWKTRVPVPLR